jgi:hypothetical protein
MSFKGEVGIGDLTGIVGFVLALVSFFVALHAGNTANRAAEERAAPSTFLSKVVTYGGARLEDRGIDAESKSLLTRLEARGVRSVPFPRKLVVPPTPEYADASAGTVRGRVTVAYEYLLIEVTNGDCIVITRLQDDALIQGIDSKTGGTPREFRQDVHNPGADNSICAGHGLLLPLGTFTVSTNPAEALAEAHDLSVDDCVVEFKTRVEPRPDKERCDDAATPANAGLG